MIVSMWSLSGKKYPKLFKKSQNSTSQGHVHRQFKFDKFVSKMKTILNMLQGDVATDIFHNTVLSSNGIC